VDLCSRFNTPNFEEPTIIEFSFNGFDSDKEIDGYKKNLISYINGLQKGNTLKEFIFECRAKKNAFQQKDELLTSTKIEGYVVELEECYEAPLTEYEDGVYESNYVVKVKIDTTKIIFQESVQKSETNQARDNVEITIRGYENR